MQELMNKIIAYRTALLAHGFIANGAGAKPWSNRYSKGDLHIDTRNTEWTAYKNQDEICTGPDPETLTMYLTGDYQNGGGL